jgi:uncharacterized protein (TIGR02001 family)
VQFKTSQKLILAAMAFSGVASAQTAAPAPAKAPEPDYTLSYNIGAVTEYRYRGLAQGGKKPALQGGIDFAHKSGFYLGTWLSTITWIKDSTARPNTTKGPVEMDIYGGYKGSFNDVVSYDVGGLQYWYIGNNLGGTAGFANANTFELYGAITAGPVTAKYSQSTGNLFGFTNSRGSGYFDLSASFDLGSGFAIAPHIGMQTVKNNNNVNYTDYSVAVTKDFDGLVLSATLVGTNFKSKNRVAFTLPGTGTKDLGGNTLVLGIKKNF